MASLPPAGELGSLRQFFPDEALQLGNLLPGPATTRNPVLPSPNLRDAPQIQGAPVTPEDEAAGLLSGASRGGSRDGFADMLLQAGIQGAGPLSGIFAGLGAALAGKDPDFAAAAAQEGFRRLDLDRMNKEAFEMQKKAQRIRTLQQAVSVATAAKVPRKRLQAMVQQLLVESGINIPEASVEMIVNRPEVRNMIWPKNGVAPTEQEQVAYLQFLEEEGLDPASDPSLQLAHRRLEMASLPELAQKAMAPGEIIDFEGAVKSLVAQGKGAISEEHARSIFAFAETTGMKASLFNQIADRVLDQGTEAPIGYDIASMFASAMGMEDLTGPLARLPVNQVGPVMSQLRQAFSQTTDQFLESMTNQVRVEKTPFNPGQIMRLQRIKQENALKISAGIKGIEEQIYLIGDDKNPSVQMFRAVQADLMHAMATIPDLLHLSEDLANSQTLDELGAFGADLYDDVEATFGQ